VRYTRVNATAATKSYIVITWTLQL